MPERLAQIQPDMIIVDAESQARDTLEQKRPPIANQLIVRVRGRLEPGKRYTVVVRNVRAVGGTVADRRAFPGAPARRCWHRLA